jgi:hypothetical protein
MKIACLTAASVLGLALAPAARADDLCGQLSRAVELAKTGFGPAEGEPMSSNNSQYWRSNIQLSAGENCAIEGHRVLSCSWEPSTADDLNKMVASVEACFPNAEKTEAKADADSPPETSFKFDQASIEIGLTADVLSLNVGP